ncbi:MAG: hypothetical protein SFU91_02970 [Chloroherpetonaceae bacterium]|nr:hypothetical protein [Chloroherpetonaceae bacterium]
MKRKINHIKQGLLLFLLLGFVTYTIPFCVCSSFTSSSFSKTTASCCKTSITKKTRDDLTSKCKKDCCENIHLSEKMSPEKAFESKDSSFNGETSTESLIHNLYQSFFKISPTQTLQVTYTKATSPPRTTVLII